MPNESISRDKETKNKTRNSKVDIVHNQNNNTDKEDSTDNDNNV